MKRVVIAFSLLCTLCVSLSAQAIKKTAFFEDPNPPGVVVSYVFCWKAAASEELYVCVEAPKVATGQVTVDITAEPGTYQAIVKAKNKDGIESPPSNTATFEVYANPLSPINLIIEDGQ